ncbi:MAG: hypothetical protein V1865_03085 [bacterium]
MPSQNDNVQKLIEENIALTKDIYELTKKVKKYMLWAQIFSVIKIILILAPIIIALIYLPPIFREAFSGYTEVLNVDTNQLNSILP